ncbi:transposase [Sphingomonas sp.]|uniref:transposase n=1 Tax=Sphingomonas sp. TaxID=28214 RepID=UPI003B00ACF0
MFACVRQFLAHELEPGDVVAMGNLSARKVTGVAEAVRAIGTSILYSPPYSPDLNPIVQVFLKLEALLRKAVAPTARPSKPASANCSMPSARLSYGTIRKTHSTPSTKAEYALAAATAPVAEVRVHVLLPHQVGQRLPGYNEPDRQGPTAPSCLWQRMLCFSSPLPRVSSSPQRSGEAPCLILL